MMLVSSVSVGVLLLLLLLPLVMWLLCRRPRATKQPGILVQSQMSVRVRHNYINADEEDDEEDYVNVDAVETNEKSKEVAVLDEEASDDYDDPVSDEDHDYEEVSPNDNYNKPKEACVSVDGHREDEGETSDEEDNYENISSPSLGVDNDKEEETSDEENDYENVSLPSTVHYHL
ncbi:protein starmaker-like isoform X1 [Pundamilia nyererei]|uniref:Protein starmaker-like isoform X1 n=1 Tax=Pundamilia nyererei TaxID=303518 RepID=A0A9Y3S3B6_9CICH|nr:PREDICTED: protein starmaker-like isoform X1 [Pundamilia nyererei]